METNAKHTILLVDDEEGFLKLQRKQLQQPGYNVLTAADGEKALEILQAAEDSIALIIADQHMPGLTGAQFLEQAKKISPDSIRFLMTGYADIDSVIDAINRGEIHRYLSKPIEPNDFLLHIKQAVEQFELVAENRRLLNLTNKKNVELEKKVMERSKVLIEKYEQLEATRLEADKIFEDTILLLSTLTALINPELDIYMNHVSRLSRKVAEQYEVKENILKQIEISGLFHDLGLLGLPEIMLSKDEISMNEIEYGLYAQHPVIISMSCDHIPKLKWVAKNILAHHENYDGSGFPNSLKGLDIPLGARIIAAASDYCRIVDTWPRDMNKIEARFKENFGTESIGTLNAENAEDLLEQVAAKALDLGKNKKYDPEVVEKLKKQITTEQQAAKNKMWVNIEDLKEGMILEKQLRLKDGKPILSKGLVFNKDNINSLQDLKKLEKIDCEVFITESL